MLGNGKRSDDRTSASDKRKGDVRGAVLNLQEDTREVRTQRSRRNTRKDPDGVARLQGVWHNNRGKPVAEVRPQP